MPNDSLTVTFDAVVLPHLQAARRLARRLVRDEHEAEDVVQEASLRALRYFRTFGGGDGRAWFLRIVRNTCYGWRRKGPDVRISSFDEERHSNARPQSNPEALLLKTADATSIARALSRLPHPFHQLLVLRELKGLSYRELADVVGIPKGTVMSRLWRAREALRSALDHELVEPGVRSGPRRVSRAPVLRVDALPPASGLRVLSAPSASRRGSSGTDRSTRSTRVTWEFSGVPVQASATRSKPNISCPRG